MTWDVDVSEPDEGDMSQGYYVFDVVREGEIFTTVSVPAKRGEMADA